MIGRLYIANCYMFHCEYKPIFTEDYLKEHGLQALIFHSVPFSDVPHEVYMILYDTYNRHAFDCYMDFNGNGMYRMDAGTVAMMLECLDIDVDMGKSITHININSLHGVCYQRKENK